MTDPRPLLPAESMTPWEMSHELTDQPRWQEIDPWQIARNKDPYLCDAAFLPLLAWERSVDLWFDDWELGFKRYIVWRWLQLEKIKGTPYAIREFCRLAGVTVKKIVRPRQFCWPGRSMTDEDYRIWLSRLDQVRIYPYAPTLLRPLATASFSEYRRRRSFYGRTFYVRGLPTGTRRRIAKLWSDGYETDLYYDEVEDRSTNSSAQKIERVVLPAKGRRRPPFFGKCFFGRAFIVDTRIKERVIEVEKTVDVSNPQFFATRKALSAGRKVVSIVPEYVNSPAPVPSRAALFSVRSAYGRCSYRRSNTWRYKYERYYLDDPVKWAGLSSGRPRKFFGKCRYGISAFTAEVTVELTHQASPRRMAQFYGAFFPRRPGHRLERAKSAIRPALSARDRVLILTQTRRKATVDDRIEAGSYALGDTIPA